jgi:hypothetical protein
MKRNTKTLRLRSETVRTLTDLRTVVGGVITVSRASGDGCPTSCWCVSDFVSDCGAC